MSFTKVDHLNLNAYFQALHGEVRVFVGSGVRAAEGRLEGV